MMSLVKNHAVNLPSSTQKIPSLDFSFGGGTKTETVQRYISGVFQINYGAQVTEFMPLLLSLREENQLTAALGLRSAAGNRLFCEQYLDAPAESHVHAVFGCRAPRNRILEMGNLVASNPGHAALLYTLAGMAMYEAGVDYLLFTANRAVRISLKRSGLPSVPLATADRSRLGTKGCEWGSYYNGDPMVMLGDVHAAIDNCLSNPLVVSFTKLYQDTINELVEVIQSRLA